MGRGYKISAQQWVDLNFRLDRLESRRGTVGSELDRVWNSLKFHHERIAELEKSRPMTTTDKVRDCPHPDDRIGEGYSTVSGKFLQCSKCGARWGP